MNIIGYAVVIAVIVTLVIIFKTWIKKPDAPKKYKKKDIGRENITIDPNNDDDLFG